MRTPALTLLAIACAVAPAAASDKKYSVADLKVLVGQKSYREAIEHAADVAPADRKADWVDVVAEATGSLLATIDADAAIVVVDSIDREYPALLKAAKYTKLRNEYGPKGLTACFAGSYGVDECVKLAKRFVENTSDAPTTLKVAKLVRTGGAAEASVGLFERALASNKAVCKDDDAKAAVIAGLGVSPDDAVAKSARGLATTCYADMKTEITAGFDANSSGYFAKNTCDLLKSKNAISGLQLKRCQKK